MKVTLNLEVQAESVAAAVQQVLYAIDTEGGDQLEILSIEGAAADRYGDTTIDSTTVVHNHVTQCDHTPDACVDVLDIADALGVEPADAPEPKVSGGLVRPWHEDRR